MTTPQISQNESFLQDQSYYSPQNENESVYQEQVDSSVSDIKQQSPSRIEQMQVLENWENNDILNISINQSKNQDPPRNQNQILTDSHSKNIQIDESQEIIYQKQTSQRHSIKQFTKLSTQTKNQINNEQTNGIEKENSKKQSHDNEYLKLENNQKQESIKEDQLNINQEDQKKIFMQSQEQQQINQQEDKQKNEQQVQFQKTVENKISPKKSLLVVTQAEQNKIKAIQEIMQKYNKLLEAARTEDEKKVLFQQISILNLKLKKIQQNIILKNNLTKLETSLFHGQSRDFQSSTAMIKDPIKQSLTEIFQFYSRQAFLSNKKTTFEQLQHKINTLTLAKFMYFCKDFGLVDVQITLEKVQQICQVLGFESQIKSQQRVVQKFPKYPLASSKPNTATKQFLVEQFKKSSANSQELLLEEFEICLQKIASQLLNQVFDQLEFESKDLNNNDAPTPYQILLQYLEIQKPSEYRKKMQIVGAPFDMREKVKVTQEQLKAKVSVPQSQRRKQFIDQSPLQPPLINHQSPKLTQFNYQNLSTTDIQKSPGPKVTWDNLSAVKIEALNDKFDPRDLLQDSDFDDYEDELYLNEYNLKGTNSTQLTNQPKVLIKIDNDNQDVQHNVRRITNARGVGYSQRYGLPTGNMGSTEKQKIKTEVKTYKGDFKNNMMRDRSGSTQRSPQDISMETYSRAQQLEIQQKQKEAAIFQQVLRNHDHKVNKINKI